MASPVASLTFVSNLFTSKIFLTQVTTLVASVLSAAGVHVLDDQETQQQIILVLDALITAWLRWQYTTGPVSVSGPISTSPPRPLELGRSVVYIAPVGRPGSPLAASVRKEPST